MHCCNTGEDVHLSPHIIEQPSHLEGSSILVESSIETDITLCPVEFIVSRGHWGPVETRGPSIATVARKTAVVGRANTAPNRSRFFSGNK